MNKLQKLLGSKNPKFSAPDRGGKPLFVPKTGEPLMKGRAFLDPNRQDHVSMVYSELKSTNLNHQSLSSFTETGSASVITP